MNPGASLGQLLSRVTDRAAISWPVFSLTAFFSILIHLFTSSDMEFSNLLLRSLAAAASVVPMFAIVWLAFQVPTKSEPMRIAVVYASFILGGAIRGLTLATLLDAAGILPAGGLQFRTISGMMSMSFTIAVLTYVWSSFSSYLSALKSLRRENAELRLALARIAKESSEETESRVTEITQEIVATLSALKVRSASDQVAEIMSLINDKVRPLSKSLASESKTWGPQLSRTPKGSFLKTFRGLNFVDNMPPAWLTIPLALAPFPIALAQFGLDAATRVSFYSMLLLFPSAVLGLRLVRRLLAEVEQIVAIALITLTYLLLAGIGALGTYLALLETSNPSAFVVPGILAFLLFAWTINLGLASWAALKRQQQELDELAASLRWAVARANLLSSHNRRMLSKFLHGPVQSSLHATAIRLRNEKSKTPNDQIFDDIRVRLTQAKPADWKFEEFQTRLWEIELLWEGLAEVTLEIDPEAKALLTTDSALASQTVEICSELCSVAIRKLDASKVSIQVRLSDLGQLEVAVKDDGKIQPDETDAAAMRSMLEANSVEMKEALTSDFRERYLVLPSSRAI